VLLVSFVGGGYAAPTVSSMFITNNPLNVKVVAPETLSVLIFNGATSQGQIVTYPVSGWRTVSIAISAGSSSTCGSPFCLLHDWGFVIAGVKTEVAPRCYLTANLPAAESCFLVEPGQNNPVPVQGDQVWFSFNQDTINATVTIGLLLQR
jgi:hypothetical protein